ncbi:MAG: hypothetical protein J0L99_21665 [Chitinophagales bacterium]|nr:hypothetical protein [Chitinophagales bacterium]
MRNILLLTLAAIALPLFSSCKKDAELVPEERPFTRDFFTEGILADYDGFNKPFDVTVGREVKAPLSNLYTNRSTGTLDIRKHIESGFYGFDDSNPGFSFTFNQEGFAPPGATASWSKAELEAFFTPGKVFKTDGTPGNVLIRYLVPVPDFIGLERHALSNGSGSDQLIITAVEDYTFQLRNIFNQTITFNGKKVSCSFSTNLQRPIKNLGFDQYEYAPARIEDGKATFFVAYQ